jgi:hypothetical protein
VLVHGVRSVTNAAETVKSRNAEARGEIAIGSASDRSLV